MLLPWHEALVEHARRLIASNRLPHALLVTAPQGWGETPFANWLALELLGVAKDQAADLLAHTDLRWVKPDGAVIKIEMVRELARFASSTPGQASCKVAVLEDAHALNPNAANALLKTLEEPPPNTYLLLVTAYPGQLLATIRSRCQPLQILAQPDVARRWLAERLPAADIDELLFEYGDAPLDVLGGVERGERPLGEFLARVLREQHPSAAAGDLLAQDVLGVTGRWYRHCQALLAGSGRVPGLSHAEPRAVIRFTDELVATRRQLQSSNSANARLLLERLLVRWHGLGGPAATEV